MKELLKLVLQEVNEMESEWKEDVQAMLLEIEDGESVGQTWFKEVKEKNLNLWLKRMNMIILLEWQSKEGEHFDELTTPEKVVHSPCRLR